MDLKSFFLWKIITGMLTKISPQMRAWIILKIKEAEIKAKETKNQIDDIVVLVLKIIFDIQE